MRAVSPAEHGGPRGGCSERVVVGGTGGGEENRSAYGQNHELYSMVVHVSAVVALAAMVASPPQLIDGTQRLYDICSKLQRERQCQVREPRQCTALPTHSYPPMHPWHARRDANLREAPLLHVHSSHVVVLLQKATGVISQQ